MFFCSTASTVNRARRSSDGVEGDRAMLVPLDNDGRFAQPAADGEGGIVGPGAILGDVGVDGDDTVVDEIGV